MSGFDFDGLRDSNAPRPGPHERAGVNMRARELRARSRRNRLAMSATSIVAVAAIVVGVVATQRSNGPSLTVAGPTSTAASAVADRFIPATSIDNGIVTVPVTLPDGETLTMQYPQSLGIARLGFGGSINVRWPVSGGRAACCGAQVSISYTTVSRAFGSAQPLKVYAGANGTSVPYLREPPPTGGGPDIGDNDLVFQFGPWLVRVDGGLGASALTDAELTTWARDLTGTVDSNGFLVLHAEAPLSIGNQFDGGFGPTDVGNFVRLSTHSDNRQGQITCGAGQSDTSAHRSRSLAANGWSGFSWCVGNDLHVAVGGRATFVDLANKKLQVSALSPATVVVSPPPSTTTTGVASTTTTSTTLPTSPSSPAASASWVSADQGWVLEQNGQVDSTTDGGASWHRVGSLGMHATSETIRFIGPSDGFAFGPNAGARGLLITHDAGATWTTVDAPFSNIQDLAISNGMIYVVAMSASQPVDFQIWSTPVGHLVWKQDARTLQVGAGPIPSEQIVLSGGAGWILNEDRTIISGARLNANGNWASWNPPCLTLNGPAFLAASTTTDMVAACSEHDYGGGPVTSGIYFSHDAGTTFERHPAPGYGPVTSPSANTAVLSGNGTLWRTTNNGGTWQVVYKFSDTNADASDLGFTTTTQGFVISTDGEMVMTHDAGATWQKVILP